jgi:hypothetical protein
MLHLPVMTTVETCGSSFGVSSVLIWKVMRGNSPRVMSVFLQTINDHVVPLSMNLTYKMRRLLTPRTVIRCPRHPRVQDGLRGHRDKSLGMDHNARRTGPCHVGIHCMRRNGHSELPAVGAGWLHVRVVRTQNPSCSDSMLLEIGVARYSGAIEVRSEKMTPLGSVSV